ncbi:MAG: hypothetical protein AAFO77_04360 [Pseudomonadota bacterium]
MSKPNHHRHQDQTHHHGPGHNHEHDHDHMHSHVHTDPEKERMVRLQALATSFIDGFRKADDKPAFLELAGIPQTREGSDGLKMHLIDATIESKWQLGTASPAFASRELVHLPYPAALVYRSGSRPHVRLTKRR